jgi:hypothetical protein
MISHPQFNFVFVGVPKTASTSMRARLFRLGVADRSKQKHDCIGYPHAQHYTIQEYRRILGDELDSRFKFAFVRNPWSRLVSSFTRECTTYRNTSMPKAWVADPEKFQEWLKTVLVPGNSRLTVEPQLSWITDDQGNVAVDYIGRFENLPSDFNKVLDEINQTHPLPSRSLWTQRRLNASDGAKHYSHYYDDETLEIVRKLYEKDIEYFGYTFERIVE